ncbi:recombination-related endonuclease [Shewanella phage Thanatos-2]|nr:recombination-related endonuclease [Shewanella phage Thanatos-2]
MKILNIGDMHLGVKADDPWIQNIQRLGILNAINISAQLGIKTWIQYGDVFDVRKHITHSTMEFARELFDAIEANGISLHVLVGNHDMTFKNKINPNAVTELLARHKNITIYDRPKTVEFDGVSFDIIPWMCEENTSEILEHIRTSSADYCCGHWELNGFYFYKGMKSHGLEPDFLKKYKKVYSGHFHTISEAANVKYIGTPWTLTAGDENDPRGFTIFDTETETTQFIENPVMWHKRITYPCDSIKVEDYRNLSVRLIATEIDAGLTKLESKLESVVHELRVVSKVDFESTEETEEIIESMSTSNMIENYIDGLDVSDDDKIAAKTLAKSLLVEVSK